MRSIVIVGASLVLQDEFDGGVTLDLIERHRATVQYGIPTLFVTQLHEQDGWTEVLETNGWTDAFMAGDEFDAFVADEITLTQETLRTIGLIE